MSEQKTSTATIFYLDMVDASAFCPTPPPPGFTVTMVAPVDPEVNRQFYRRVGASWQWLDRSHWCGADWQQHIHDNAIITGVGNINGQAIGYFELARQADGNVELAYFGLLPSFIGRKLGSPLLSAAVNYAWHLPDTRRLWLHTCSDDHPHALANYQKRGFKLFKIEPPT